VRNQKENKYALIKMIRLLEIKFWEIKKVKDKHSQKY